MRKNVSKDLLKGAGLFGMSCAFLTEYMLPYSDNLFRRTILLGTFNIGFIQLALIYYIFRNRKNLDFRLLPTECSLQIFVWILLIPVYILSIGSFQ